MDRHDMSVLKMQLIDENDSDSDQLDLGSCLVHC